MAANLSGWDLQDMTNGFESKFIDSVSREILKTLCDGPLHVGENLVGIDFHLDKLDLSRFVGSDKVNMIGICGISGIGKTTLAKAVYDSMHTHFDRSCFCDNVQGVEKQQGLTQVQMQMIGKILKTDVLKISSVGEGSMVIKQRMACKRILLVLDDVNNVEQLEALAGSRDWFFPGSFVIFTGKDKQLLTSHRVDEIYKMGDLDECKALELFSLHAFGIRHPTKVFEELASQVIIHLQGHPLALKIIGRSLYGKSMRVWKSNLHRLQTYPNSEIVQKLRPSFDGLASDQKRMFLDIACAFIGENKDFAASVLDSGNISANAIIEVLADKFLITVSADCIQMHELIQSMAREIIREEFEQNHSRLLISSEDCDILDVNKVAEVEVVVLFIKKNYQTIPIDGQALTRMKNLRILKICFPKVEGRWQPFAVNFSGRLDLLSNKLRLLCWHGLPLESLPSDFYPENIVAIDLSYSHIKQLWTTPKCLRKLKVMKLTHCCNLTTTPDFSVITNLEELDLEGCVNLVTVHPSIGMLKRLVFLNMTACRRAWNLLGCLNINQLPQAFWSRWWTSIPGFIWNQQHPQRSVSLAGLHMLKSLNFSYCNLYEIPESIGGLSCLERLNLQGNNFTSLPGTLSQLSHLQFLYVDGCKKLEVLPKLPPSLREIDASYTSLRSVSLAGLHMLECLILMYCNLEQVPETIGGLSCLEHLYLEGNNFTSLPGSLSQLSHLTNLYINGCKKLEVLPELPPSVWKIVASDCISLREVSRSPFNPGKKKRVSVFRNCPKLFKNVTIDSMGFVSKTQCLDSSITSKGSNHRQDIDFYYINIVYHGNSMPEWFTNRSTENHLKVELPSDWCFNKFRGFGTCVVFKCKNPWKNKGISVKNFNGAPLDLEDIALKNINTIINDCFQTEEIGIQDSYMIWLHYSKYIREWKEAKNFVTFCFEEDNEDVEVKECGVRLIL